ncbi:MFS transporter [Pseudomonas gingeri]|uniref:MFS transporter n=2 Tax=Pseudomonas gingeri TaxID=117681 RepID=UPI001C4309E1|nr:MFS transporter [Pseudomonas gingeri]
MDRFHAMRTFVRVVDSQGVSRAAQAMAFVVVGGNVFGMLAPVVTGYVISATGSYNWAFVIAGGLLVTGAVVSLGMTRKPMIPPEPALAGESVGAGSVKSATSHRAIQHPAGPQPRQP